MKYLGVELQHLVDQGAIHTAREISQQPDLWEAIWRKIGDSREEMSSFLGRVVPGIQQIVLTGAGTSAYIGHSLVGMMQRRTGVATVAIASTDLVSHPKDYLQQDVPTLLISFARSGNSPESVATVALAEELCRTCYHLVITCNAEGQLAAYKTKHEKFVFALPPEANDQSLAMTSSYTGMLLAAILIAHLDNLEAQKKDVDLLISYGRRVIESYTADLERIAEKDFRRAFFLGSGPLLGTARESNLKIQELTDGQVVCKEDSFLGFRHGPKAVIDDSTLVFYIFSNKEYVLKYERDLLASMKKGRAPLMEVGIMESRIPGINLDQIFYLSDNGASLSEEYLAVCSVLPAQILGFFKSLKLGLRPDAPSATGAITRVVEGVQIYDLNP